MKSRIIYLYGLFLGIFFLFFTIFISDNSHLITKAYKTVGNLCEKVRNKEYCFVLFSQSNFEKIEFIKKSKVFTNSQVPLIKIYLTEVELKTLKNIAVSALRNTRVLDKPYKWVNGKIIFDNGISQKKSNAGIRLKGDLISDHFGEDSNKLSMRIRLKGDSFHSGTKIYSIQHPVTRNFNSEPMLLDMMREFGVLAPKYFFAKVLINEKHIGLMAFEEHFSKYFLENQSRREGPILAIDEAMLMEQTIKNILERKRGYKVFDVLHVHLSNMGIKDYPVKLYESKKLSKLSFKNPILSDAKYSISQLRNFLENRDASKIFDYDLFSKWIIISNMWNAYHGLTWNNHKFYFNPITKLIEPIAFDNESYGGINKSIYMDIVTQSLLKNEMFQYYIYKNINLIRETLKSPEFERKFENKNNFYFKVLSLEFENISEINLNDLMTNLNIFESNLDKLFNKSNSEIDNLKKINNDLIYINNSAQSYDTIKFENKKLNLNNISAKHAIIKKNLKKITNPLKIFFVEENGKYYFEIENIAYDNVLIHSIFDKYKNKNFAKDNLILSSFQKIEIPYPKKIRTFKEFFADDFYINYSYKQKNYEKEFFSQVRSYSSINYLNKENAFSYLQKIGADLDEKKKTITFSKGQFRINKSLELPKNWELKFEAGSKVIIESGKTIKINGPINVIGEKKDPVKIIILPPNNLSKFLWGGISVLNAEKKSNMNYVEILGGALETSNDSTEVSKENFRQGLDGLTGCITFYNSDVKIANTTFENLHCEDAINIFNSSFDIDRSIFKNASYDAIDSDFSNGEIKNSDFINIFNDGIDLSGSNVVVSNITFKKIMDKAISVGERSNLVAKNLTVLSSNMGVVSKDSSKALVIDSLFENITEYALMSYIKKKQFEGAMLDCKKCVFNIEKNKIKYEDEFSSITF